MNPPKVIIKKYENRRLYDTTNSRYVNLDEVAEMLRQGTEVQAIDAATGEDLTRLILTQIIVDGAKDSESGLPLDILRQMVVATGRAGQETLLRNTRAMLDMYQKAYGAFTPAVTPFDFMQTMMKAGMQPAAAAPVSRSAANPTNAEESDSEVKNLRRRIDELERIVAQVASKKARSPGVGKKAARKKE
jgi:polyhydroxyalkanoate synthesis repressor PhaR